MQHCSAHFRFRKGDARSPPKTMAKPAWPQHTQEISLSQTKQGMREAGCQMSVFNRKLCKIPQEAEKKKSAWVTSVDYLVETEQTSSAGFPSEPLSQILLQTQTPGLFQIQIDCLFSAPYWKTFFIITGNDTESYIFWEFLSRRKRWSQITSPGGPPKALLN